jgi:Leucine-rich repeat (LRR) protein
MPILKKTHILIVLLIELCTILLVKSQQERCLFSGCKCQNDEWYEIKCEGRGPFPIRNDEYFVDRLIARLVISNYDFDQIPLGAFSRLNIATLILKNNRLNDLRNVVNSLEYTKEKLLELDLSRNSIEKIGNEFEDFSNLRNLSLSNNFIKDLDSESFLKNTLLNYLALDNNRLEKVPNLKTIKNLWHLNLQNQNGQLTSLNNYAFETTSEENSVKKQLELHLDSNNINRFENKAFCSRTASKFNSISLLKIDYQALKNANKCLLRQLNLFSDSSYQTVVDVIGDPRTSNYSDICNCQLKSYLNQFRINLGGVCQGLSCAPFIGTDDCANRSEFFCENLNLLTTTRSTNTGSNLNFKHLNISFIFFIFSNLFFSIIFY